MRPVSIISVITRFSSAYDRPLAAPLQAAEKSRSWSGYPLDERGMSMYGSALRPGGQIAVEEINAAGGILGRP